jgi:hypothetical protein
VDRIEPIAPDRSVPRVDLTYLTPLEREQEKQRRERERKRRQASKGASEKVAENRRGEPNSGLDVRA